MAPADVLVASRVNGMVGLEMCSATPPDKCKLPSAPRLLQHAGIHALTELVTNEADTTHTQLEDEVETFTLPTTVKRKRYLLSPTSAGILDCEGPETSPDEQEDSQPERKRRKVDAIKNALKRFHEEETKTPRCVEYTTICHPKHKNTSNTRKRREAAKMRVQIGVSLAQGARQYMEDRYSAVERLFEDEMDAESSPSLLAVYDGHNGAYASEYARRRFKDLLAGNKDLVTISRRARYAALTANDVENICELLADAFATVDAEILQRTVILNKRDGSTVLLGLLVGGKLFVANLGDSRGVLAQADDNSEASDDEVETPSAVRLSIDHKPDLKEEMDRVQEAGGKVIFSGCWRVAHDQIALRLAISRSLGDHPLKTNLPSSCSAPLVSVIPDVRVLNVEAAGEYLVFASDGLWDRLSDDDAAKIVRAKVAEFHCMDNITVMVISFSELPDKKNTNV
ncbi:unnamed protein product [Peronospora destructor]|uniref:PPM-type phosphatase domain-containing protein n=1 Tax=Peronospora destructor TaxID=86335 RepID=A0AAV0T6V2_9STRA|nr:unnamed protein product [Peronospora destructor]